MSISINKVIWRLILYPKQNISFVVKL